MSTNVVNLDALIRGMTFVEHAAARDGSVVDGKIIPRISASRLTTLVDISVPSGGCRIAFILHLPDGYGKYNIAINNLFSAACGTGGLSQTRGIP